MEPDSSPFAASTISSGLKDILAAPDRDAASKALGAAVATLGYDGFCLGSSAPVNDNWALSPVLTNWPVEAMTEYARRGFQAVDPTIRHLRRYHTPYVWDARVPPSADTVAFFEFLMTTSVKCGVVIPLGLSSERLWVLSVSRSRFVPLRNDVLRILPIFGHAAKAIYESVDTPRVAVDEPGDDLPLSVQQVQFLRWAAEGKSSTDIATITGHSKRMIDYHFSEILRKLQVATRAQAIGLLPDLVGTSWSWSGAGAHTHNHHI